MAKGVRLSRLLGPLLILAGATALVVGFLKGEATLNLFIIFPVITATGGWSALGILLLIAGCFALFLTWTVAVPAEFPASQGPPQALAPAQTPAPSANRRWGGVIFLGPVPVVFGSDANMARWMILVGVLLFVGLVVLTVISIWGI